MIEAVAEFFRNFPFPRLSVFIISMLPVLELRGGLIAASLLGVPAAQAALICFIGNILPIPFVLLFIKSFIKFMKRFSLTRRLAEWIERRAEKQTKSFERGSFIALFLFVAIPLPGTGGWTGALIASLLDMPLKRSVPAIFLGVFCAGVIMMILAYFIPGFLGLALS